MRSCRVLPFFALLLAVVHSTPAAEPIKLPEPPQQETAWEPNGEIPTNILSAAKTLFAQGFPDPRGCEYRMVKVTVSSVWEGKGSLLSTHGWVLPPAAGDPRRFVICWNGAMYPAVEVGDQADLSADAKLLPEMDPRRFNGGVGETASVISSQSSSTRVVLLLRRGLTLEALKTWSPDKPRSADMKHRDDSASYDPYLEMASDWAWSLFDQAISAHMRGDSAAALAAAEKLTAVRPKIEAEAERRGFRHQSDYNPGQPGRVLPYLYFIGQLPDLVTDLNRRAAQPDRIPVMNGSLKQFTNSAQRIRALIGDLDLVTARQWSQPGGIEPSTDPIVAALIAEGDAAVDPLLECVESDKRLTRSVGFARDFKRSRHVLTVAGAATAALEQILHSNFNGGPAQIRAYWNENHGIKLEDRWYNALTNDLAKDRWAEAAENITQPTNIVGVPGTGFSRVTSAATNAPISFRGESLRTKMNPSVSELLARRAVEVAAQRKEYDIFALHTACGMALHLMEWDVKAGVPTAKRIMDECVSNMMGARESESWTVQYLGMMIGKLTMARVRGGDGGALKDYAAWMESMTPKKLDSYLEPALEPMAQYYTNIEVKALAARLFDTPGSGWNSLPWEHAGFFDPIESELVKLPAFRRLLAREMEKKEVIGSLEWHSPDMLGYKIGPNSGGTRTGLKWPAAEIPPDGAKTELRRCDWIGVTLAQKNEIPFFNPFLSVDKRDAAIKNAIKLLAKSD